RVQRLEAACHGTRPQRRPGPHRPDDALEVPWPEVLQLKEIADKSARAVADDDRVRLGDPLQARSEVRRLANDAALLRLPRPGEIADNHQPRRNSDTGLQGTARPKPAPRCDRFVPGPYGPPRVVLMGLRITKVHEDAIPHISGDEPAEVVHGLGDAFLIDRNDLSQVLRVHAGGKRGGTT